MAWHWPYPNHGEKHLAQFPSFCEHLPLEVVHTIQLPDRIHSHRHHIFQLSSHFQLTLRYKLHHQSNISIELGFHELRDQVLVVLYPLMFLELLSHLLQSYFQMSNHLFLQF